jgi:N-acetylmuramoyl-L-alanine amidase CwlA
MDIKWIGAHANNFQKGRNGTKIDRIVLHWIVGTLSAADSTFQNGSRQASAHYGIGPKEIHQYVKEEDTAYHAGNFPFNLRSIGIEHEGGPNLPIAESVYEKSARLVLDISTRYGIPLDRQHIYKHSEIKATQCPGTLDVDRVISMAIAFKGEPEMANTINITNDKFKELVQKATQSDAVADVFGFDRMDADLGNKVKKAVEDLKSEVTAARKDSGDAIEAKSALEKTVAALTTERDELATKLKAAQNLPPKVVTKEVEVEKIVAPRTLGELFSVIGKFVSGVRGGDATNV